MHRTGGFDNNVLPEFQHQRLSYDEATDAKSKVQIRHNYLSPKRFLPPLAVSMLALAFVSNQWLPEAYLLLSNPRDSFSTPTPPEVARYLVIMIIRRKGLET